MVFILVSFPKKTNLKKGLVANKEKIIYLKRNIILKKNLNHVLLILILL